MYHDIDFTVKAFNSAQRINDKDTEYRVRGKEHLRLSVNKNSKSLRIRACIKGKRINKKIGNYPQVGLKEFEKIANTLFKRYQLGGNYILAETVTFDRYFQQLYLPNAKKYKSSWKGDESRYRLYIKHALGHLTLPQIRPYHIQRALNDLPAHLSDRSYDLVRALISSMLSLAVKLELIEKNPCRNIPARNNCRAVRRYLTDKELPVFIDSCLSEFDTRTGIYNPQAMCLLLSLFTGMRIGNCCDLRWDMLSKDGQSLYLPKTKSGKGQIIYLSKVARWIIEQAYLLKCNQYIFPSSSIDDSHVAYPRSVFTRVCARSGIACAGSNHAINEEFPKENLTIHCLRKTFATVTLNSYQQSSAQLKGTSLDVVRQLLGHSNEKVTKEHYAFGDNAVLLESVEIASQVMTSNVRNLPAIRNCGSSDCFNSYSINQ